MTHASLAPRSFRELLVLYGLCALALSIAGNAPQAGGYLALNPITGASKKWTASPIILNFDLGPVSATVNNATGRAWVLDAIQGWTTPQIPTSSLSFAAGTNLTEDHGDGAGTDPAFYDNFVGDGLSPVIFDQTGLLVDSAFGAGANQNVIGFARGKWASNTTIMEGEVVLNGLFIDGSAPPTDLTTDQFKGVIIHEVGHMVNLDHAYFNTSLAYPGVINTIDESVLPTMYPYAHGDILDVEADDIGWVSYIYPTAAFAAKSKIEGIVRDSAGNPVNGVNVLARNAVDYKKVVSCVSGYNDPSPTITPTGAYLIPGLDENSVWTLEFEQIPAALTDGSSVGVIDPPLVLSGPQEFINDLSVETGSDSVTRSTSFKAVAGGVSGVDVRMNSALPNINITEVDPAGNAFPGEAMNLSAVTAGRKAVVSGNLLQGEGGNVILSPGDPIEDWYLIAPPAGLEIAKVTLTPSAGDNADLYIAGYDGSTMNSFVYSLQAGGGVVETLEGGFDTTLMPNGQMYIGVSTYTGSPGGAYTLTIEAQISKRDTAVLTSVDNDKIDAGAGSFVIRGRGFKNTGGAPTVTLGDATLQVGSVTYVSPTQLNVNASRLPGWVAGTTTVQVQNASAGGSYAGRLINVDHVPVKLSAWGLE